MTMTQSKVGRTLLLSHLKTKVLPRPISIPNTNTTCTSNNTSSHTNSYTNSNRHCYNLYNATTSKIRAQIQSTTKKEIKQAIQDGYEAQQLWYYDYTPLQRSQVLINASRILAENFSTHSNENDNDTNDDYTSNDYNFNNISNIIQNEINDTSRPISEITSYDIPTAIQALTYYSQMPSILPSGSTLHNLDRNHSFAYTTHEPLGLTIGIGAWNYPLVNAVMKSAPSIIFGNSMIYKPSEITPMNALRLAQIYEEAGLPDGVFQVCLGYGEDVGYELLNEYCYSSLDYNVEGKISFTGSVETGRRIAAMTTNYNGHYNSHGRTNDNDDNSNDNSKDNNPNQKRGTIPTTKSSNFHRLNLELGGKSPLIIMKDCNIDQAVTNAMNANWYSNGQVCSNGTRVFVHTSIYDEFVSKLVNETSKLKIGNPNSIDVDIGPMVSKEHMERVLHYIDIGKNLDGATLIYGGERVDEHGDKSNNIENGCFLSPAIFTDCNDEMRIVQEEVFGMLMTILTFDDEDEVIRRANATHFGLAAGVITNDIKRAHRMASRLKAGTVWINNYNTTSLAMPWGAVKQSGIGRENGIAALEAWTTEKVVFIDME